MKNLYKVRFSPSGVGDELEFVINSGQESRFQFGLQRWLKLVTGQGKDGKTVFFRYYNNEHSRVELLSIIGTDEYSQIIELDWPEEITQQTIPGFVCPCGKVTDVLYWHPKLNAWFCSYPHEDYKIRVYKKKVSRHLWKP
jgi:hypothetical protein